MCAVTRFQYIKVLFHRFRYYWGKENCKKIEIIIEAHKFYIKVSLYSLHCYNNHNSVEMSILLSLFSR